MLPRILMIIQQFRPICGGAELQAERLGKELVNLGFPVTVLTEKRDSLSSRKETLGGLKIIRAILPLGYRVFGSGPFQLKYLVENRKTYDIFHVHQAFGHALMAVLVAKRFQKKCIVKIACAGEFGDLEVFSKFFGFGFALRVLRLADAVIAISSEVEKELKKWKFPNERIVRIPNGVDAHFFSRETPLNFSFPVKFLLVGRRHPQKGVDTAISAVKILKERGFSKRFSLNLVGRDYPGFDYKKSVNELGLQEDIQFSPFNDEIKGEFEKSHCFILPSRGEGLSNSLLEAMALELPVIATKVSGTEDVIEANHSGILIRPDSPEELAEAMEKIIHFPEESIELGRNARKRVLSHFSLEMVARAYSKLYNRLQSLT